MKAIVPILLAAALSFPVASQTLSEQLQKGIYAEETAGNRDEAIRIYREILAAPTVPRAIADEAERRLARLLLPSRPPAEMARRVYPAPPDETRGRIEGHQYRHVPSGITFDIPDGWITSQTVPSSDNGDMVMLRDPGSEVQINVWMIKEETPSAQLAARAAGGPAEKLRQRHSGYGIPGMRDASTYDIPADTLQPTQINGKHAMIAVGHYEGVPPTPLSVAGTRGRIMQRGQDAPVQPMDEYMTWIYAEHSRAFFFARVPANDLSKLRTPFDRLVNSAVIP